MVAWKSLTKNHKSYKNFFSHLTQCTPLWLQSLPAKKQTTLKSRQHGRYYKELKNSVASLKCFVFFSTVTSRLAKHAQNQKVCTKSNVIESGDLITLFLFFFFMNCKRRLKYIIKTFDVPVLGCSNRDVLAAGRTQLLFELVQSAPFTWVVHT